MINITVTIINKLGLHARAAAKFVAHASRYVSEINVIKGTHQVNGKSIMGVMMLAASKGAEIHLHIDGSDEQAMADDLMALIHDRFGETD